MTLNEWIEAGNTLPESFDFTIYGADFPELFTLHFAVHTINDSEAYPFAARLNAVAARVLPYYETLLANINAVDVTAANTDTRDVVNYAAPNAVLEPPAPIGSYRETSTRSDTHYNRALARAELAKAQNLIAALLTEFSVCFANWEEF